jgi:hypothetical protein
MSGACTCCTGASRRSRSCSRPGCSTAGNVVNAQWRVVSAACYMCAVVCDVVGGWCVELLGVLFSAAHVTISTVEVHGCITMDSVLCAPLRQCSHGAAHIVQHHSGTTLTQLFPICCTNTGNAARRSWATRRGRRASWRTCWPCRPSSRPCCGRPSSCRCVDLLTECYTAAIGCVLYMMVREKGMH